MELKIIRNELITEYLNAVPKAMQQALDALEDAELSTPISIFTHQYSIQGTAD